jgi:ABC-type transport system involved in cytochrome bd biosynthesis fused ATPase/permease subunit
LVYSFDSKQYFWLISALIFRIILVPIVWLIYHNWVRFVEILEGSIWISTGKYFLTVDPIYHTTQSSGQMVSKINRAAQGYFDLVTLISWEIISLVIGALSVIISSVFINLWIGIYLGLTLGFMTLINIWLTRFNDSIFQENRIPIEDDKKDSELESLQQASYIRTVFATKNQLDKQISKTTKLITLNFASWRSSGLIWSLLLIFYFLTGLGLVFKLINMVESSAITSPTAIALVSSFFLGTTNILQAGNQTQRLTRSIISITDLFDFIRGFGKQSFPVLEENAKLKVQN